MASDTRATHQAELDRLIAPGPHLRHRSPTRSASIVLTAEDAARLVARLRGRASALLQLLLVAIGYLLFVGHRRLGRQRPGRLGLRHHQLRLVDRHRPRGHADLRHPAAAAPGVAHLDQPLRRGDDALRGGLRRPSTRSSTRAGPGSRLLAASRTRTRWACGRTSAARSSGTCSRSRPTPPCPLLFWFVGPHPRPRHPARPRDRASPGKIVYGIARHGLARLGPALAQLRDRLPAAGRPRHAARGLACTPW